MQYKTFNIYELRNIVHRYQLDESGVRTNLDYSKDDCHDEYFDQYMATNWKDGEEITGDTIEEVKRQIDLAMCEHKATHPHEIEETADYEYRQATGQGGGLTYSKVEVCDACDKTLGDYIPGYDDGENKEDKEGE